MVILELMRFEAISSGLIQPNRNTENHPWFISMNILKFLKCYLRHVIITLLIMKRPVIGIIVLLLGGILIRGSSAV
jgi:hypothetical protein